MVCTGEEWLLGGETTSVASPSICSSVSLRSGCSMTSGVGVGDFFAVTVTRVDCGVLASVVPIELLEFEVWMGWNKLDEWLVCKVRCPS